MSKRGWRTAVAGGALLLALTAGAAGAAESGVADAARADNLAQVTALLQAGGVVDAPDGNGATALTWASHNRNQAMVSALIARGANPNAVNEYGFGPLLVAAQEGDATVVRALLAAGADPNLAAWNGETPLMHAARIGAVEAVEALLKAGAKVDAREIRDGQTALMWAAASGKADAVRALLAGGASTALKTPTVEIGYPMDRSDSDLIKVKKGGFSALHFAVGGRDAATVKVLLDAGMDANDAAADQSTPLLLSLYHHVNPLRGFPLTTEIIADVPTAELLLSRGADPNRADVNGLTPLAAAAFVAHGHDLVGSVAANRPHDEMAEQAVKALLAKGADPNLRIHSYRVPSPAGQDPRTLAYYADTSALLLAAVFNKPTLVKMMLDSGRVNLEARGVDGGTPLIAMAKLDSLAGVRALAGAGANVNAADANGDTPLHVAARGAAGSGAIAQALLDAGARWDLKNKAGLTAVDVANGPRILRKRSSGGGNGPVVLPKDETVVEARGLPQLSGPSAKELVLAKAAGRQVLPEMWTSSIVLERADR